MPSSPAAPTPVLMRCASSLGNTGSKTTIHRYLKELEDAERGRDAASIPLSEQLANLVSQLADQLEEEAQAAVALEREQLTRERLDYQHRFRQAESRIQQLEGQTALDAERLQTTHHELQQAREQRQQAEIENARLQQANRDLEERHKDRDAQIHSLEEKHRHARDTLEHYRQASKEQREQEQRRHESQVQQLQLELRQLQQTLIIKQDEPDATEPRQCTLAHRGAAVAKRATCTATASGAENSGPGGSAEHAGRLRTHE